MQPPDTRAHTGGGRPTLPGGRPTALLLSRRTEELQTDVRDTITDGYTNPTRLVLFRPSVYVPSKGKFTAQGRCYLPTRHDIGQSGRSATYLPHLVSLVTNYHVITNLLE